MSIKWLSLFMSISLLSFCEAASTPDHLNAYDSLLKAYTHERTVPNYHEKIYEILGGSQGFSDRPATPIQLSNIVYIAVHAALNSTEADNLFLRKILEKNQMFINSPGLSEKTRQDRAHHYGILMVVYVATKLSQKNDNIFTLPERVQDYLKGLAEDYILTGVLSQSLKDLLSRANKDGISQLLASYKFTNAYHSASLNVDGLMLDGNAVVDYSHGAGSGLGSGVTTRASSSSNLSANPSPSPSTETTSSVPSSDVPADIAHLNEENRKKLKRMQLFTQTEGNEQARARQIDVLTRSQAAGVGGGVGPIGGLGGLLAGKANALNKTGGPSSTANVSATQPEIDLKSMFNLSAIKKIGKDLSIESADSKDEKIAKLQAYKEELTKISAGTDETEIKQAVDYLKIVNFLIKELKKKTINPQIIDLLTKRGSTMGISVSVITEDSLLEEIQNLETQITKLRLDLAELEMSKVGLVEGDKKLEAIQRQTISKQNAIRTKSEAVSEKTKERRLLIAKTKEESAKSLSSLASSPRIEASVSSASPVVDSKEVLVPVDSTAKLDAALMIRVEPPPPIAVHSSKSVDLSSAAVVVGPSPIIKSAMASGPALAPPEKSLRLGGTGSILGDIRTATSGGALRKSITRGIAANIKHMRLEELKELKIEVEGELAKLSLQIERLRLEIQNLIVAKQSAMDDTEKEKIEKKVLSKTKLLEGKEIAIKEKEGTISEINNQIPIAEILQRRAMLDDGEDSSSDSDEDPDDWD